MPKLPKKRTSSRGGSSRSASDPPRQWIVIGNPENRRVALFQAALRELHEPPAKVISYRDCLVGAVSLPEVLAEVTAQDCILRIESPGENHAVERLLVARGSTGSIRDTISLEAAQRMRPATGRIRHSRQWFAGFSALLKEIEKTVQDFPQVRVQNHPRAIRLLFNKPRCHDFLASRGVSVPPSLPGITGYDSLREAMRSAGWSRVFVKLAWGSSASGVVAFSTASASPQAITSMELVRKRGEMRFYNNLRLSRYSRETDLRAIFDFLGSEGVHVEQWLPKASQGGRNFDLRVVTIAGQARHKVIRTSRSPLTNLHLGNRRGDLAALKKSAGSRWDLVTDLCEQAAVTFPDALYVGWDVLVTPNFRRAYILEGNAFGDLLPTVLHAERSTYAQSIESTKCL